MFDDEPDAGPQADTDDLLAAAASMTWVGALGLEGARRMRAAHDSVLYDIEALSERERSALAAQEPRGGDILAVHPGGARGIGVYRSVGDLAMSIDAMTRVVVSTGPGTTPLGAAAFARSVADALGEPAAVVAPTYSAADVMRDLSFGIFAHSVLGARRSPEAAELTRLLLDPRLRVRAVVGHSVGAWTLSEALFAMRDALRSEGLPHAATAPAVVTLGAAATMPGGVEACHVVGALDAIGWSLSDSGEAVTQSPLSAGHHVNPSWPSAIDLGEALAGLAPCLKRPARSRRGQVTPAVAWMFD